MRRSYGNRTRAGLGCGIVLTALAAAGALPAAHAAGGTSPCTAADTQVWVGLGGGGGFAGGQVLPLEFSNVARHACTLSGYPGVSAYRGPGRLVGRPAARTQAPHGAVRLAPGATAHATLRVSDTGAVCGGSGVSVAGLRIYPPGQRTAKTVTMPLAVCAHVVSLRIGPVRRGVGIPGYTTP